MTDSYKHKGLRKRLIKQLREKGISDEAVLNAMGDIPRHTFLEGAFAEWAYRDTAFPIDCQQTISQPYTVARQTILLNLQEGDKVLEIGTGSGYQAAILAYLGAEVHTIERIEELYKKAKTHFEALGYSNIRTYLGDGYEGLQEKAPFDKIIVTAGAKETPNKLLAQLKIGGLMVIPIGEKSQVMYKIERTAEHKFKRTSYGNYRFVPMLKGTQ